MNPWVLNPRTEVQLELTNQVEPTVIIKIRKTTVAVLATVTILVAQAPQAGMFDNLVNAANSALPVYGREATRISRADLSDEEIEAGIREALSVGVDKVLARLSDKNGYANDTSIRISLPGGWKKARKIAARIGFTGEFDNLEQQLNQAAETAVPATGQLFLQAIKKLPIEGARSMLYSNNAQATDYLRRRVSAQLEMQLRPVINQSLDQAGALEGSDRLANRMRRVVRVRDLDLNLSDHVVTESLDGFFYYLEKEEMAIRTMPASRTSDLLRKVFG